MPISDVYAELAAEPVTPSIRKILKRDGMTLPPNATLADALAARMFLRAIAGDCGAAKEIREAIEGKPGQRVELATVGKSEVTLRVVYDQKSKPAIRAAELNLPPCNPRGAADDHLAELKGVVEGEQRCGK